MQLCQKATTAFWGGGEDSVAATATALAPSLTLYVHPRPLSTADLPAPEGGGRADEMDGKALAFSATAHAAGAPFI